VQIPKKQTFPFVDYGEPKNVGEPNHIDLKVIYNAIKEYMKADEVELAIYILNHLPSYYKDNPPVEFVELRRKIFEQVLTTQDYIYESEETPSKPDLYRYYKNPSQFRFTVVSEKVKQLNKDGIVPHITELGAGEFWLAYGMFMDGLAFTYYPICLNKDHFNRAKDLLGDRLVEEAKDGYEMYICMETAEHLWNVQEIYHYYARYKINAKYLAFSTPKYTCFGGIPDWELKPIGHIRAWSPLEFHSFLNQYFTGFKWFMHDSSLMVFTGETI